MIDSGTTQPTGTGGPTRSFLVSDSLSQFQPIRVGRIEPPDAPKRRPGLWISIGLLIVLVVYFFTPAPTRLLILGIDRAPDGTAMSRSDIMVLTSIDPFQAKVALFSIPRDLWVSIPGQGENRINTAHFFAEIDHSGSGPAAAARVVEQNFGVRVPYQVRIQFDGFRQLVEALGGVTITLAQDSAVLPAGTHYLNPDQALAFVRDRKGADDFSRMQHTQLFLKAVVQQVLKPSTWPHLPAVMVAVAQMVDTNLPAWLWPRLGFALLRAGPDRIDSRTVTREMVTPFTTNQGANVLLPNWDQILPVVQEMFGR